jgi:deoxyribodipyrimidine photo-lyase
MRLYKMQHRVDPRRIRKLNEKPAGKGPVVYWMSRDQRTSDNWALLHAQDLALHSNSALIVVFCLVPQFLGATLRQYRFMLKGLAEVEINLRRLNIEFVLLSGNPEEEIARFLPRSAGWGSDWRFFTASHQPALENRNGKSY